MRRPWVVDTSDGLPARRGRGGGFSYDDARYCCDRINAIWKRFGIEANARPLEIPELRGRRGPFWAIVSDLKIVVPWK